MKVLFVIDVRNHERGDEALRAALGATLCGAQVDVVIAPDAAHFCNGVTATRARATLEMFGHRVTIESLTELRQRLQPHTEVWR
jgi:phage FluMu gp28-like protein